MKLTIRDIGVPDLWELQGVHLPCYDVEQVAAHTKRQPGWVHFGAGNIFRIFLGGVADDLLEQERIETGIIAVETYDHEIIEKIYAPHDNLTLAVTLHSDGNTEKRILGSIAEAIAADGSDATRARLQKIFAAPSLQLASFTITEKGYAVSGADSSFLPAIAADIAAGPDKAACAMGIACALLLARFNAGAAPIAMVSMDNCSRNGEKLRCALLAIAQEWQDRGFVPPAFVQYLSDEARVSFPWSMIDKITPRPAQPVCDELDRLGIEGMVPAVTAKGTYMAPFVNAEGPQYLVIEDRFPNGRPDLAAAGVYLTDRDTVGKVERMKVTTCLNPLHTALAVYGCLLGYTLIADEMKDPELAKLVWRLGPEEGMPVVTDPGILSPEEFVKEVIQVRFPNPYMPDAPQRIATDTSQKVGIRFGETIKSYMEKYGSAERLTGIPLAIAGWCRYLLAVDDKGEPMELSGDPMLPELQGQLAGIHPGQPESYSGQLKPILSNARIFGVDLYEAGIGARIEELFCEQLAGPGAVRKTLQKHLR